MGLLKTMTVVTIGLVVVPGHEMTLTSESIYLFKSDFWNCSSLLSACRACSQTVHPPRIYMQPPPFAESPSGILPLFEPVIIQANLPPRGPALVVLSNGSARELDKFQLHPGNCYVLFVLSESSSPFKLLKTVWDVFKLHHVFVVVKNSSSVVSYNPFTKNFTQSATARLEKYDSLYGANLRIVMFPRPPNLTPLMDDRYGGVDGELLRVFQSKMNFTMVTMGTSDHNRYGYRLDDGTYVGTLRDILSGRVDLAINGHFIKNYGTDNLTFTYYVLSDKLCALVPKAGLVPHVFVMMRCFSPEVWASVLVSYILIALIQHLIKYVMKMKSPCIVINILQNIFNAVAPRCPKLISDRVCQISMLFFTFIIVNAFQGQIITFLYTPIYFPEIDTLQEIDNSGLEIFSSKPEVESMMAEDPKLYRLAKKVHTTTDHDVKCAARTRDIVRFSRYSHIDKVSLSVKEDLHLVSECLSAYFIAYVVPRGSPFLPRLNILISRALESGLVLYWSTETDEPPPNQGREIHVLSIDDLQIAFIIIGVGLLTSICVFIIEVIIYRNHKPNAVSRNPRGTVLFWEAWENRL